MGFNPNADDTEYSRELVPETTHLARCARVIEIGQHLSGFPTEDGRPEKPKDKAVIVFSLPGVMMDFGEGEKQAHISNIYGITMSSGKRATMRQYAKALDPGREGEDLGAFVNKPCQVSIRHKKRTDKPTIAVIDSVAPVIPGYEVPPLDTEPFWFEWNNPKEEILRMIPQFTLDIMKQAVNYKGSKVEQLIESMERTQDGAQEDPEDDYPF